MPKGKPQPNTSAMPESDEDALSLSETLDALRHQFKLLIGAPIVAGAMAYGLTWIVAPTYTAITTLIPPQNAQSGTASALASLGALAGFAVGGSGPGNSGDRYIAFMQSMTLTDRIIDKYGLITAYDAELKVDARKELASKVRFSLSKKDGLISIEVDDKDPKRAADIANSYVDELRNLTSTLAVTEAQQRRVFFERLLALSRDRLTQAQQALQSSGIGSGALKAEPKMAAESYARLKADVTAAEMRLQILRSSLADGTPEVRQQQMALNAMRVQLANAEQPPDNTSGTDYIGKYREFKYQEALFDLYARQFEIARVDESREGALIQVIDTATPPQRKSKPKRIFITLLTVFGVAICLALMVGIRATLRPKPPSQTPLAPR